MAGREEFWGVPSWAPIFVYTVMGLAALIMLFQFYHQAKLWWKIGMNKKSWNQPFTRLIRVFKYGILQTRSLEQRYPGLMHLAIAWAFFVFFIGTAMGTINGHGFPFLFGNVFKAYKLVLNIFIPIFLIGIGMAAYRRFVQKPQRLTYKPMFIWSLALLTVIVLLGSLVESFRLAIEKPPWAIWSIFDWGVAQLWIAANLKESTLHNLHQLAYFSHMLAAAAFLVILPRTQLIHIFTAPLNIFFSDLDQPLASLSSPQENKDGLPIFARDLTTLTWSQLLNGDACTECGRCQDACPAYASGAELNPKQIILDIRDSLHSEGQHIIKEDSENIPPLTGSVITKEVLWSCTACGACVRECAVLIDHLDIIVDMRRQLVDDGDIDTMLQDSLANLGRYGNSFGQSERARAKWTKGVDTKIPDARKQAVEYLWFVGDYASYNPAIIDKTQMTAQIFQTAGLDFGIMYDGERNSGNDVRRIGEEGLFEMLVEKNSTSFEKSDFKAIVTTDPHSLNALKNEYPDDIIQNRPILHYSELLYQLIESGQLKLKKKLNYRVTYHDPCLLGRYNNIYDAPRKVIQATGCQIIEMPRNRSRALCCGAGGGHIWVEEGNVTERPSENRIKEAAALNNVPIFVVACPKDITMYQDAVKTTGFEEKIVVKDLIELVYEALQEG